jgi:cell division protein FtsB
MEEIYDKYLGLCAENDKLNEKWAHDNERHGEVISQLQAEIKELKEENTKLKEGTLLKFQEVEIEDLKEEIEGWKKVYVDYAAGDAKDLTFENFGEYLDAEPRWLEEDIEKQEKEIEELEGEVEKLKEKVEDLEAEGNLANEQVERLTEVEKKLLAELADSAPLRS